MSENDSGRSNAVETNQTTTGPKRTYRTLTALPAVSSHLTPTTTRSVIQRQAIPSKPDSQSNLP
ncbi:MAG: hypothetical protein AAFS10_15610, partial [Myxococcota bacterium]